MLEEAAATPPPLARLKSDASNSGASTPEFEFTDSPGSDVASSSEVEQAVLQVVQVFSKPQADRERLFKAVFKAVTGECTIKEASHTYGFATSTMHPYVHRARSILGPRAPQMRSNRIGISSKGGPLPKTHYQFPAHLQNLKTGGAPLRMEDVIGPSSGSSSPRSTADEAPLAAPNFLSMLGKAAVEKAEEEEEPWPDLFDDDEEASKSETPKAEPMDDEGEKVSPEDAAREALAALDLSADQHMRLFLCLVRVLNREQEGSEAAGACPDIDADVVEAAVERAKELGGYRELTLEERHTAARGVEIEAAVARATSCSNYTGDAKDRLYTAVLQTIKGELPLTQAAATHAVPFSTLHPYVKRAKAHLGLIPASEANALKSPIVLEASTTPPSHKRPVMRDVFDRSNSSSPAALPGLAGLHKNAPSPLTTGGGSQNGNGTPTKSNPLRDLPDHLKNNTEMMERAVRKAVQSCQYDDVGKKERLCSAVMAALRGEKTMKYAAAMHDVPFTTLQTYFHRSRAQLERDDAGEDDIADPPKYEEPPTKIPRVSDVAPSSGSAFLDALGITGGRRGSGSGGETSAIWARLKAMSNGAAPPDEEGCSSHSSSQQPSPAIPTGSSRRKPRKVVRNLNLGLDESELSEWQRPASVEDGCSSNSAMDDAESEMRLNDELFLASNRNISDYVRDMMAPDVDADLPALDEPVHVVEPRAPEDEPLTAFRTDDDPDGYEVSPAILIAQAAAKLQKTTGKTLEPIALSPDQAARRAIRNSQYEGPDRERLRLSVLTAIHGERTMKEASKTYAIPLGTFHTYYHRTRNLLSVAQAGLDPDSPPVVALLNHLAQMVGANSGRKKKPIRTRDLSHLTNGSQHEPHSTDLSFADMAEDDAFHGSFSNPATAEEVEMVVARVIKASQYPPEQKDRLQSALVRVIKGDGTINSSANNFSLPSSTLHPYVHRARKILGDACPEQAKLARPMPPAPGARASPSMVGLGRTNHLGRSPAAEPTDPADLINPEDLSLEEADKVVSQLVKSSLYNEEGRQRLYEAILMVITEASTVSEASRAYGIPPSTIQPYVMRARTALHLPLVPASHPSRKKPKEEDKETEKANLANLPIRKTVVAAPRVYAAPGNEAADGDIEKMVREVVKNSVQADDRRERLYRAVLAAVSGKATIKDGCTAENLPASTVHPYVSRARHLLGSKCPPPKIATACPAMMGNLKNLYKNRLPYTLVGKDDEVDEEEEAEEPLAIDEDDGGGTPELEMQIYDRDEELDPQMREVLDRYNFRGDRDKLQTAIMAVVDGGKGLNEAAKLVAIAPTTLSPYVRIARLFVKDGQIAKTPYASVKEASSALKGQLSPTKAGGATRVNNSMVPHPVIIRGSSTRDASAGDSVVATSEAMDTSASSSSEHFPPMADLVRGFLKEESSKKERIGHLLRFMILNNNCRKNDIAKRNLIDAVTDVLVHGIKATLRAATTEGVSENMIVASVERTKDTFPLVETALSSVLREIREEAEPAAETPPSKRSSRSGAAEETPSRCGSAASVGSSPTTPTRISRRLQAKAEAKAEPLHIEEPDIVLASLPIERALLALFRRLLDGGFPVTADFVSAMGGEVMRWSGRESEATSLTVAWAAAFRTRHALSHRP